MPIHVNLRHLEDQSVLLEGQLPVEELDIETRDEMIRLEKPVEYELEVQQMEGGLLVEGSLRLPLQCQCVRCLKAFTYDLELPEFHEHIPLQGEDAAPVLNDVVDLTPHIREDILLELPQHPLCDPDCRGLLPKPDGGPDKAKSSDQPELGSSAWSELNKLKL
jgi:uncharacterized protein